MRSCAGTTSRSRRRRVHSLPGYREPAAIRTFDAPEALDVRFYEVQAKSVLNKVPKASRMPFRWTINPYRGCTHACVYCAAGETPILMADGRHKPLADVGAGDAIYGTFRNGWYRSYMATDGPGPLADGQAGLPCGARRRHGARSAAATTGSWTGRAKWKHVTGGQQGSRRRPHLTLNDNLMGVGGFAVQPDQCDDYREGYLCGLIRGDGHLASVTVPAAQRDTAGPTTSSGSRSSTSRRCIGHASISTSTRSAPRSSGSSGNGRTPRDNGDPNTAS